MLSIILDKNNSSAISNINGGGASGMGAWVVLIAGNEDGKILANGVTRDITNYTKPCDSISDSFDVDNNPALFNEDYLITLLAPLLQIENDTVKDLIWDTFKKICMSFNGFAIEDNRIIMRSIFTDSDDCITSYNASYQALCSLLLKLSTVRDGIIVVTDFDTSNFRDGALVIENLFMLAVTLNTTLILQTTTLNTVNDYMKASQPNALNPTLITIQGNTANNCDIMAKVAATYKETTKTAAALNMAL